MHGVILSQSSTVLAALILARKCIQIYTHTDTYVRVYVNYCIPMMTVISCTLTYTYVHTYSCLKIVMFGQGGGLQRAVHLYRGCQKVKGFLPPPPIALRRAPSKVALLRGWTTACIYVDMHSISPSESVYGDLLNNWSSTLDILEKRSLFTAPHWHCEIQAMVDLVKFTKRLWWCHMVETMFSQSFL